MERYFSTPSIFTAPLGNIDRQAGIIYGVTIAQEGPAKGHGAFIDRTFLLSIVDNAATKPAGIKARFGHPNMCSTALGSYLGRFKNYSYSGNSVKADLYLDETSKNSPSGDLYSYVLDMAEKNPDMFGASIYFQTADSVIQKEEIDGKTITKEYFRLLDLRGTDIVDEPAATDGLFSATTFPGIATQFLDANPEIAELIFSKPENVIEFFNSYLTNSKMNLTEKVKESFASFLSVFSAQPPVSDSSEQNDEMLNSLFESLSVSFPESFENTADFTQLQKAASISNFLTSINADFTSSLESVTVLSESLANLETEFQASQLKCTSLEAEIISLNNTISTLTSKLSARPTIPLNVIDPLLSVNPEKDQDNTGKDIYKKLSADDKLKLKNNKKS